MRAIRANLAQLATRVNAQSQDDVMQLAALQDRATYLALGLSGICLVSLLAGAFVIIAGYRRRLRTDSKGRRA